MFKRLIYILFVTLTFCCSEQKSLKCQVKIDPVTEFNQLLKKENLVLYRWIAAFAVDNEENIYILDNMGNSNRLIKIDRTGKFRWELNTIGQGPGEFLRITDVCCSKDKILVCDQNKRKIIIFSKKGEFINEFRVNHANPLDVEVAPNGLIFISFFNPVNEVLLHKYTQEGEYRGAIIKKKYSKKNAFLDAAFNQCSFCIDSNNNIILAYQYFYSIYKYDIDGNLINKWSRNLSYKPQKPRLVQPAPNQLEIKADSVIQDVAVDNSDRIFVLWGSKGVDEGMQVDLFSSDGELLSEFRTGIKPFYNLQLITIGLHNDFYVANRLEEPNLYKFLISISE